MALNGGMEDTFIGQVARFLSIFKFIKQWQGDVGFFSIRGRHAHRRDGRVRVRRDREGASLSIRDDSEQCVYNFFCGLGLPTLKFWRKGASGP